MGKVKNNANIVWGILNEGKELPITWSTIEYLACSAKPGNNIFVVNQGDRDSDYNTRDFGVDSAPATVFFTGSGTVSLRPSSDGRPFEHSIFAPFAEVELWQMSYVKGFIIAREFNSDRAGGLVMFGSSVTTFRCGSIASEGECSNLNLSDCADKFQTKKRQRKCKKWLRKGKCSKDTRLGRKAQRKCQRTCGLC